MKDKLTEWLTDYMELSPWEAVSHPTTQVSPNILWNLDIYYRIHRGYPLVPILSQMNSVHSTPS
jgi:hypothetical protein